MVRCCVQSLPKEDMKRVVRAVHPEVKHKNRFRDILPCKFRHGSRVRHLVVNVVIVVIGPLKRVITEQYKMYK